VLVTVAIVVLVVELQFQVFAESLLVQLEILLVVKEKTLLP
jgi:hypothetical protein